MKGKPDFTGIPDDRLKEYVDLTQEMIFAYKYYDEEKVRVLTEVWKQMSDEYTDRMSKKPFIREEPTPKVIHKIKTVKSIKRIKC